MFLKFQLTDQYKIYICVCGSGSQAQKFEVNCTNVFPQHTVNTMNCDDGMFPSDLAACLNLNSKQL